MSVPDRPLGGGGDVELCRLWLSLLLLLVVVKDKEDGDVLEEAVHVLVLLLELELALFRSRSSCWNWINLSAWTVSAFLRWSKSSISPCISPLFYSLVWNIEKWLLTLMTSQILASFVTNQSYFFKSQPKRTDGTVKAICVKASLRPDRVKFLPLDSKSFKFLYCSKQQS